MTTPASFSTEGKIISKLAALKMRRSEFVRVAEALGIPVSEALISLCLAGQRRFTAWTGLQLENLASELVALRDYHRVPLNWAVSESIATMLCARRAQLAAAEIDGQKKKLE